MSRTFYLLALLAAVLSATLASADRFVVELWNTEDVATWVNNTVGYPEYSQYFMTHLVDGPTLLNLEVEDLEDTMPLINRIHIAKFKGHLAILKDQCLCKQESSSSDFWSHLRNHQVRSWILGSMAIFAPRFALIGAYFFDGRLYEDMTSVTVEGTYNNTFGGKPTSAATGRIAQETSWLFTLAYWIIGMLFPSAFMLLNFIPYIGTNFLVVPILCINFIVEQHREVFLFMSYLYGDMKDRSTKEILMALFPLPTFFPVVGALLSLFAPLPLLQLSVVGLMIFSLFIGVGFVMMLFSHGEGAADEAADAAARAKAKAEQEARTRGDAQNNNNNSKASSHDKVD